LLLKHYVFTLTDFYSKMIQEPEAHISFVVWNF
jgi:hypothetical protein